MKDISIVRSKPWAVALIVTVVHRWVCNMMIAGWMLLETDMPLKWACSMAWDNVPGGRILSYLTLLQFVLYAWIAARIPRLGVLALSTLGIPCLLYAIDASSGDTSRFASWNLATGASGFAAYGLWALLSLPTHRPVITHPPDEE